MPPHCTATKDQLAMDLLLATATVVTSITVATMVLLLALQPTALPQVAITMMVVDNHNQALALLQVAQKKLPSVMVFRTKESSYQHAILCIQLQGTYSIAPGEIASFY